MVSDLRPISSKDSLAWYRMLIEMVVVIFIVGFTSMSFRSRRSKTKVAVRPSKRNDMKDDPPSKHALTKMEIIKPFRESHEAIGEWQSFPDRVVKSIDGMLAVVEAYLRVAPDKFVHEVVEQLAVQGKLGCFASDLVHLTVEKQDMKLVEDVVSAISNHVVLKHHSNEIIVRLFAFAGEEERLASFFQAIRNEGSRMTARGFSFAVRGLLHAEKPDGALKYAKEMRRAGLSVSQFLVTEIYRLFCKVNRAAHIVDNALPEIVPNAHAAIVLLEHCLQARDVRTAKRVEEILKDCEVGMPAKACEAFLKLLVSQADPSSCRVMREMHSAGFDVPNGFCAALLIRAADAKFVDFAEDFVQFVKQKKEGLTITLYGALMKVYSCSNNLEKACDLYAQVKADGLQPDHLMLTCLMKFAVEINRQDLIAELEQYVSRPAMTPSCAVLLRNASQERDVETAFRVLSQQEAAGKRINTSMYNSVLDACVGSGDCRHAADLVAKMRKDGKADIVTYNTLLKVFARSMNLKGAQLTFEEIERAGLQPDIISYNILINIAVDKGDLSEAWLLADKMKSRSVRPDGYTVSTFFKAVKRSSKRADVVRVFNLLDDADVDFSRDEVLVNCVLGACVKYGDTKRASDLLALQASSGMQPAVDSYGVLIRAAGFVGNAQRCHELWHEMINVRQFIPTAVVLGCMTSALVQVGCADDAFALVKEWTSTVQPNQVVYTMLLRGFVESDRLDMGLEVVKAMHAVGLPVTRNIHSLILEGFVRSGDGEGVAMWVKNMDNENVQFDMKIITILAKHYCVAGAFEDCLELLKEVSRQDRKKAVDKRAQTMAFDKLVDCLVRTERYAEAAALVEKIDEFDVQPSKFTLASVVTLWGCSRQLDKAFAAVESLTKKYDISPNNLVRMCLLKSCLANNDISRALRVFKIMRSTSEGAGRKAFEAMICGCAELGWHMESVRLVEEAFGLNGVAPTFGPDDMDFSVLETVAKSLDAAGLMESLGKPLFLRLREKQRVDVPAH